MNLDYKKSIKAFFVLVASLAILNNCSGGVDESRVTKEFTSLKGSVVDAEIANATVFLDLNGNFKLDSNEPSTKSDKNGKFELTLNKEQSENRNFLNHKALLIAYGGEDIRIQKSFTEVLSSVIIDKNKEIVITPISTLASQWLIEELANESNSSKKLVASNFNDASNIKKKIEQIYKDLSDMLQITKEKLLANPIELYLNGDSRALEIETKLYKAVKLAKKALKKEYKKDKHSIFNTYRSVAKELKRLKKDAKKKGDKALEEALESALNDNKLYAQTLKSEIKREIKVLITSIDSYFKEAKESIKRGDIDSFIKNLENNATTKDTTAPTVELKGENPLAIELGESFIDPGAKAVDDIDGELNVTVSGAVNISKLGEYMLTYRAVDNSGNEANVTRVVKVVDTTAPTLKLKGANPLILNIGDKFQDPGVESSDNSKEQIKVTVVGVVDNTKLGEYKLIYKAVDNSGNEANVTRVVKVINTTPPKDTYYKSKWFEPAKEAWNKAHPDNQFTYDWWEYKFPKNADLIAGEPSDKPITPKEWIESAGLGMSMKIDIPSSNGIYNYTDKVIKAWKEKGFRAGRFHIKPTDENFQDLELDPSGATLKKSALADLKSSVERFVNNGMPLVISLDAHKEYANVNENREEAFRLIVEWWRQIAETLKDVSYTVAFENFVEFHGFDDQAVESEVDVKVDNGEDRYPNYTDSKGRKIDNYVRNIGYNNLMSELSRVIRVTNPKRIMIYKPLGIGRYDLPNVAPWRWKNEGDPLGIVNQKSAYWLQSMGGSANLKTDYVLALRESNATKKRYYLQEARKNTWGNAVDYYNQTQIPIWISLWGARLTKSAIDRDLGGVAPDDSIYADYVNWYQKGIQTEAVKKSGERVRIPSGFQQSWWIWDFKNSKWFDSPVGNFNNPIAVRDALIANKHGKGLKAKNFAPTFIPYRLKLDPAYINRDYNQTIANSCAYDKGEKPTFTKVSGADWLMVSSNGNLSGTPTLEDEGVNSFILSCSNKSGTTQAKVNIAVEEAPKIVIYPSDDTTVQKNQADKNYGDSKFLIVRNSESSVARKALLKFNVADINGSITQAKLRLYSINHKGKISLRAVSDTTFRESSLTWSTMPQVGEVIATSDATDESWVTFDLTNYIKSEGVYALEIDTLVDSTGKLSSKEGSNPPELIMSLE